MKNPVIVAGFASIVALAFVAFVFAATGDDDEPRVENPPLLTAPGGWAAFTCPSIDVPGISQEERERCFDLDSPGDGAEAAPIDGLEILVAESFRRSPS